MEINIPISISWHENISLTANKLMLQVQLVQYIQYNSNY